MSLVITVNSPIDRVYAALAPLPEDATFLLKGYPAVRDRPEDSLFCTVYVSIAEQQVVSVDASTATLDPPLRACEMARRGVEIAIDSLSARR